MDKDRAAYYAKHYADHRDEILAKQRAYYAMYPEKKKANGAAYYVANREKVRASHAAYRTSNRERDRARRASYADARYISRTLYLNALKSKPCMDCGRTFPPECMDFDHRDPTTKLRTVGQMRSYDKAVISLEIAKCDLVCANCHRIRTKQRKRVAA